jgi:esterase/lipase
LSGHNKEDNDYHSASKDKWLNELNEELSLLKSKYKNLPLYALGYSLGGLLLVESLQNNTNSSIERLVLLAPALKVKPYTKLVRLLFPFGFIDFSLPSLAPKKYLAYKYTSIQSYRSLFSLIDDFQCRRNWSEKIPNTLVVSHTKDLLIAHNRLKELFMNNLKFRFYERKDRLLKKNYTYHHIFAKEAFSLEAWNNQVNSIVEFLS